MISVERQQKIIEFLDKIYCLADIKPQDTSKYYEKYDMFRFLLEDKFDLYNKLFIAQKFHIKINDIKDIDIISYELVELNNIKKIILGKLMINVI